MAHLSNLPDQANQERLRILAADNTSMSTQLLVEALAKNAQFHVIEAPSAEAEILGLVRSERPDVLLIAGEFSNSSATFVPNCPPRAWWYCSTTPNPS
jgi:PleD family two-component response regulator